MEAQLILNKYLAYKILCIQVKIIQKERKTCSKQKAKRLLSHAHMQTWSHEWHCGCLPHSRKSTLFSRLTCVLKFHMQTVLQINTPFSIAFIRRYIQMYKNPKNVRFFRPVRGHDKPVRKRLAANFMAPFWILRDFSGFRAYVFFFI